MSETTDKTYVLSKRLNKILDTRLEKNEDTLESLKQLSSFYTNNTITSRRNLRSQIEKRSLYINLFFLEAYGDFRNTFTDIYNDIMDIKNVMTDMSKRLQNATSQTNQLLQRTSSLQDSRRKNDMQQQIVQSYIETFHLSNRQLQCLSDENKNGVALSEDIFAILNQVDKIHESSTILLEAGYQPLALDVMEKVVMHKEEALEKLYRWTKNHCRNVDNAVIMDIVTKAMARLQQRPVLFKYVIEEYCTSRRAMLVGEFIKSLTGGGPTGSQVPIDMRSHDIQIYVTDMLVWINKAILVEQQHLNLLVKLCEKQVLENIPSELSNICEGICQPLKIRIDKILHNPTKVEILYSVTNLIRYYRTCVLKILREGLLVETLTELQNKSKQVFIKSLQDQISSLLVRVEPPSRDLSPTSSISTVLSLLRDMLSTANMSEGREVDMHEISHCIIEPLFRAVNEQASRLDSTDMAVYLLNCMYSIQTCLTLYEFMDEWLERIQAQSDAQIDTLTSEQASYLVANLNLGSIYTILQDHSQSTSLSDIPGMEPSKIKNILAKLEALPASPNTALLPQINLLISSVVKNSVKKRSFRILLAIYKQLYDSVHNPDNKYENPQQILEKTPEELTEIFDKNNC